MIAYLDGLWRDIIRERDNFKCQICGSKIRIQAHHIFTRSAKNTRFDIDNGVLLCGGHHKFLAHQKPEDFRDWVIAWMGPEEYNALRVRSKMPHRGMDLNLLGIFLEQALTKLKEAKRG